MIELIFQFAFIPHPTQRALYITTITSPYQKSKTKVSYFHRSDLGYTVVNLAIFSLVPCFYLRPRVCAMGR